MRNEKEYGRKWWANKSIEYKRAKKKRYFDKLRQDPERFAIIVEKQRQRSREYDALYPKTKLKTKREIWDKTKIERRILAGARHRAKKANLPFNLELSDISIPDYCPVLDIKLNREQGVGKNHWNDSPSIDKIVPEKGYVKGNILIISWRANRLKQNATISEMQKLAKFYSQFDDGSLTAANQQGISQFSSSGVAAVCATDGNSVNT